MEINELMSKQKEYFQNGRQLDINYRKENLIKLKRIVKNNEQEIINAIKKDLNKSEFESYLTEIGVLYEEINMHLKR